MVFTGSLQLSHGLGLCKNQGGYEQFKRGIGCEKLHLSSTALTSRVSFQRTDYQRIRLSVFRPIHITSHRFQAFKCHSSVASGGPFGQHGLETAAIVLRRSYDLLQGYPLVFKVVPAVGVIIFAIWGLTPLMRLSRNLILSKNDSSWKRSNTHYVTNSYIQPLLLWTGVMLICRAMDPIVLPTEASQVVKQRLLDFIKSLSTVLSFAYCISSLIQQTQKFFLESNESGDTRNMGFQFAGKAVYSAVWVAAVSLFMELLGFSTQRWLTAGGLGTVLLTLAGREIFTNFLSSVMIHATRPFVVNEWIQTKIEGYEVSGTVEHVGWWSPTIIRGEDREAVHIPNHKFTVNVVRNLTQKTHWRIKTHLAISHLDVHKINSIVADMRKVLSKNPQVEQQRLHRRVFLENVTPDNQALMILISCFVKTSRHEEYLCVKEAILMDLLRVISHHKARLATPIRTVQKMYNDTDLDSMPFADSMFSRGVSPRRPLMLIEPSYKIHGEDKKRSRSGQTSGERDGKPTVRPSPDPKVDVKVGDSRNSEIMTSETKGKPRMPNPIKDDASSPKPSPSGPKGGDNKSRSNYKTSSKHAEKSDSDSKAADAMSDDLTEKLSGQKQVNNANGNVSSASGTVKTGGSVTSSVKQESEKAPAAEPPPTRPALEENIVLGNANGNVSSASGTVKTGGSVTSSVKQESEKAPAAEPPPTRPALEENIVLGVALEGSKRTLPIEEEMASPSPQADENDLASARKGSASSNTEKGKKNDQTTSDNE